MKSERLYISKLYLISAADLYDGIQDEEIIFKTQNLEPIYFTPGTCSYTWDRKNTSSGYYYINEIVYSEPGLGDQNSIAELNKAKALVGITQNGRKIVMYRNDYFNNLKMVPEVDSTTDRTRIKFSLSSLDVL
ncbi:hypothetical protein EG346_15860 [Chryseobacterium carnipullorum]|uniref:Uncharacterized protein n=1 Tax=Chryseobacterium carnipullorum TaxID=1124835 RepID=A0A376DSN1_CHRCU|nr:hypothetical protein [Chryseobacterium carnipullorum]AZA49561.1 hypothetical protein EG346_15860 [Chryseobacterium carnipullorum]AZA64458.1 hypothetical protein EG345_06875 [Chryseobacterium carnipullorum]STC94822.1 Uncharacterised protein [Chryseobacterium carnipullorum]